MTQAKAQASQLLSETRSEADRHRAIAQRQVDELTRQKDSIASHLTQLRQLLGGQLPGMDEALQSAPAKPGIGSAPAPATAQAEAPAQLPKRAEQPRHAAPPRPGNGAEGQGPAGPRQVPQAAARQQAGRQPGSAQPGSAQPGSAQPGNAQPGSAQPGSAQQAGAQPGGPRQPVASKATKSNDEDWWTE